MSDRRLAASSGAWSLVLQLARLGFNSIVFLVLARWLTLEQIGAFAIAFASVQILQNTIRGGFSETVVQDRDGDAAFANAVFWLSTATGAGLGLCLFALSYLMEPIFGSRDAGAFLAAMASVPVFVGLSAVPEGLLRRRLEIRTLALRTTASLALASVVAIWLGAAGHGGWALAGFTIVNAGLATLFVLVLAGFRPSLRVDVGKMRTAMRPVVNIALRILVGVAALPLVQLLVGLSLGAAAAGAFQIAQRVLGLCSALALEPVRFTVLPLLARSANDPARLAGQFVKATGLAGFLIVPVYFGIMAVAPDLLPLVVGPENGDASVPVLQAMLAVGGSMGLFSIAMQGFTAVGQSGRALRWSAFALALRALGTVMTMGLSVVAVATVYSAAGYVLIPFLVAASISAFGVERKALLAAVFRPLAVGAAMAAAVYGLGLALPEATPLPRVAAQIIAGVAVYLALSFLFNRDQLTQMRDLVVLALGRKTRR